MNSLKTTASGYGHPLVLIICAGATFLTAAGVRAQTVYVGNNLSNPSIQSGAPDGGAPLVILGEYNPAGPLTNATPATTLPTGIVQSVEFYGQNYSFTLYALAYTGPGPHTNERNFQVVAEQQFSGANSTPGTNTLAVTNFPVYSGDLLAFAGQGPFYPQVSNDAIHSDATYQNPLNPNSSAARLPGGVGSTFSVGTYSDTNATDGYITDAFGNQGRTYGIGVVVATNEVPNPPPLYIGLAGSGSTLSVSWQSVPGPALIHNNSLANTNGWSASGGVTTTNGTNYLNLTSPTGMMFFRLYQP